MLRALKEAGTLMLRSLNKKRGVTYGSPQPELMLSIAVIGVRGVRKQDKKRSPIKGGVSTASDPIAVKVKT